MRVKMVTLAAGPLGVFAAGQEYDVPDEVGRGLVKAGAAVSAERKQAPQAAQKKEAAAAEASAVELAAEAPEREVASLRKGKETVGRRPLPKVMGGG